MKKSGEGRVEEIAKIVGGRFKLTVLLQKQAREYYIGGRTFMPSVRNVDELFHYMLDEVEQGKIALALPEPGKEAASKPQKALSDMREEMMREEFKVEPKEEEEEDGEL